MIFRRQRVRHYRMIFLLYALPPLLLFILILLSSPSPLVVVPNSKVTFTPYSDRIENGMSEINLFHIDSSLVFGYRLKKGFPYPYAGISMNRSAEFIDLSRYDHVVITLKTSSTKSFRLFVLTFEDSITRPDIALSYRYNEIQIPAQKVLKTYSFEFSELITPSWWFERNRILPNQLKPADFSKVTEISFNNGYSIDLDTNDTLTVTEMQFVHSKRSSFFYSGLFLLFYYVALILIIRNKRRTMMKNCVPVQVIPYEKIDVQNCSDQELNKMVTFLACNFSDSDLSVQKVAEALNLSAYKVPAIIKENFNCSFKEYLNKIRIEEAKRLLSSTDRRITEIAFTIGYNSPAHFNRLFKEITSMSPREFREKLS